MLTQRLLFIVLGIILSHISLAQNYSSDKNAIHAFVQNVSAEKIKNIAEAIHYPLYRKYPIPPVRSATEFVHRYDQIFDDSLKNRIIHSDFGKDWKHVGWRGIMLDHGLLWIDADGRLTGVNYQSDFEKREWKELVAKEKSEIYPALKKFKAPVLFMQTKGFKIRIDDLGDFNYRYASWDVSKNQSDKPALVLTHGKLEWDGSGGNHSFTFKNDGYTYRCYISVIGTSETPPARLIILKNNQEILREPALEFKGRR